ncbi:Methyltransferase domain-containing protein [Evansella caseinilytica]|uniref:Methyltransferase domain-containing protein n=1 Tax=Evansella caseinilytica TaxID=1503961 RepID=A0A1H3KF51_9BACI|nr:class I SAM-dependent methyltransferase [Evansella caseinilytica]SDY50726.1 Methyltransferase domain-containing protein [Evansella caseinilytica]
MKHEHFASIYDLLMEDAPYEDWLLYTKEHIPSAAKVVDLACGTGTFAVKLFQSGFDVSGVDISRDMLTVAERKARETKCSIPLFLQDMRHLSGFSGVDGVTLFCDGLNYLLNEADVQQTFRNVAQILRPGGKFLFDVHSVYKMEHLFNDQLYGINDDAVSYLWFSAPGEQPHSVEHCLTFFIKQEDSGLYERKDEEHRQRTFPPGKYQEWLLNAGFVNVEVTGDFGRSEPQASQDRYFFKAEKKQQEF